MQFQKEVIFLGFKEMRLKDGTSLLAVSFYVDDEPVTVHVQSSNNSLCTVLYGLSFAAKCLATFTLRKSDRLYRLSLAELCDV